MIRAIARCDVGLVPAQPQQLRCGEPGQRAVAGQRDQPLEPDRALDLGALGGRALVVPEDRRAQHGAGGVERDEPVHLTRQPDAGRRAGLRAQRASTACVAAHQSSGSCSAQPARGVDSG